MSARSPMAVPRETAANVRWRMKALKDASVSAAARRELRGQCSEDILFWVNTFGWTYDPRTREKRVPFTTYAFQDDAILQILRDIREGRDAAIKKSRDMGASWVNVLVLVWLWQFRPFNSFLLVSRNEDYVDAPNDPKSLFWKIDFLLANQPAWLKPRNVKRTSMHIGNMDNGSVIDGESTTGEVGRGDRRTAILLDEFAAFETKAGYNALAATQSSTNCRIFNSTPKGSANAFYDIIHRSSADIVTMHWSQHPEKAKGLYSSRRDEATGNYVLELMSDWRGVAEVRNKGTAEIRRVAFPEDYPFILDGKKRSPWYDVQRSRAVTSQEIGQELDIDFVGSDYQFFDPVAVERYKDGFCRPPEANVDLVVDTSTNTVSSFTPSSKGRMSLFEMPGRDGWDPDRRFVMGVDVAAGTGASNSTIAVYDVKRKEKVAEYANPNILPDDFGRTVVAVARWFNGAHVVPDRSGPTGEVLVARMIADGYTNIYVRRNARKFGSPATDEPGVWLNPNMRTQVLQQYRDAISHCSIVNRSASAMDETLKFVCRMDGTIEHQASANAVDPSGARANHGDMVIADALANLCLSSTEVETEAKPVEAPEGSVGWRINEFRRARERESSTRVSLGKGWEV